MDVQFFSQGVSEEFLGVWDLVSSVRENQDIYDFEHLFPAKMA